MVVVPTKSEPQALQALLEVFSDALERSEQVCCVNVIQQGRGYRPLS